MDCRILDSDLDINLCYIIIFSKLMSMILYIKSLAVISVQL